MGAHNQILISLFDSCSMEYTIFIMLRRAEQKSQFLSIVVTATVLLRSNVLLLTMEMKNPCGGGLEYLHRCPASRQRRQREPSARGYNWATLFLGDINTGTWSSRLEESQMRE
jgi:hypothetical protein